MKRSINTSVTFQSLLAPAPTQSMRVPAIAAVNAAGCFVFPHDNPSLFFLSFSTSLSRKRKKEKEKNQHLGHNSHFLSAIQYITQLKALAPKVNRSKNGNLSSSGQVVEALEAIEC